MHLDIANRPRISCAQKTQRLCKGINITVRHWNIPQGSLKVAWNATIVQLIHNLVLVALYPVGYKFITAIFLTQVT